MQAAIKRTSVVRENHTPVKILIKGLTQDGKKFRPSDWAERLTSAVATYGRGRRVIFHPKVRMVTIDGISCVVVDSELEQSDPMLFGFLMNFGQANNLQILRGDSVESAAKAQTVG
jgi:hypothetical protein